MLMRFFILYSLAASASIVGFFMYTMPGGSSGAAGAGTGQFDAAPG
jgi:hypothetical protein